VQVGVRYVATHEGQKRGIKHVHLVIGSFSMDKDNVKGDNGKRNFQDK
jgi:hypothetical protein